MADNDTSNPVGRPTVMTAETVKKLEEAFAVGATDSEAAFYAGISKQTLYNYCTENPEYTERKEQLKEQHFLLARQTMLKALKDDPLFALNYMKAKKKGEFGSRVELTGADGEELNTGHESLKEIAEAIRNANTGREPNNPNERPTGLDEATDTSQAAL